MELIFVRHGETDGNARRQYIGRTDLPLNGRGREQIRTLRETLALPETSRVFHSPLRRTTETTQLLFFKGGIPDPRLMELDFGAWEARTYAEIEAEDRDHLWRWYDDPWQVAPPGGETLQDLDARLTSWHEDTVLAAAPDDTLVIVTHGGPLRWWHAKYVLQDTAHFSNLHVPPGGCLRVRRNEKGEFAPCL